MWTGENLECWMAAKQPPPSLLNRMREVLRSQHRLDPKTTEFVLTRVMANLGIDQTSRVPLNLQRDIIQKVYREHAAERKRRNASPENNPFDLSVTGVPSGTIWLVPQRIIELRACVKAIGDALSKTDSNGQNYRRMQVRQMYHYHIAVLRLRFNECGILTDDNDCCLGAIRARAIAAAIKSQPGTDWASIWTTHYRRQIQQITTTLAVCQHYDEKFYASIYLELFPDLRRPPGGGRPPVNTSAYRNR
jgi:hypothetical protein